MTVVKNGTAVYIAPVKGTRITPGININYVEQTIDLKNVSLDGGVLVKTLVLSVDPYLIYRMRDPNISMFCPPMTLGEPADNGGVGKVIRSEDPQFKPGDYVFGYLNFQEYSVYPGKNTHVFKWPLRKLEKNSSIPWSVFTGTLGLAGMTAYAGFKVFALEKAKTSKVMFVSGGGGPVGTFVIQYAKIHAPHLKIIASAGTDEKVRIMQESGADVAFNYKTTDTEKVLQEHGPLDIYWDNVAGSTLDAALLNFNYLGLIVACGAVSAAIHGSDVKNFEQIFMRSLTVNGYICITGPPAEVLPTFFDEVVPLILEKKIKVREHHYHGLQNASKAMEDMHTGGNLGKAVVVVADD